MTISHETNILVGDIAFRMADEADAAWKKNGDMPNNLAAGWLLCEGYRQYFDGISKGLAEVERDIAEMAARPRRRKMAKLAGGLT